MVLKHVCICAVMLFFGGTSMAFSENIIDGRKWTYFADTVMGGIPLVGEALIKVLLHCTFMEMYRLPIMVALFKSELNLMKALELT